MIERKCPKCGSTDIDLLSEERGGRYRVHAICCGCGVEGPAVSCDAANLGLVKKADPDAWSAWDVYHSQEDA